MGKGLMFAFFVWVVVSLAGGVMQGSTISVASTTLTANLTDAGTVINVTSTTGFPSAGFIQIGEERIAYSGTTATTFVGLAGINPMVRGAEGTEAAAHATGAVVRTVEASMLNNAVNYKLAVLSDASGLLAFITVPWTLLSLIGEFLTLPLGFLGTDLQILTMLWAVISIGIIASLGLSMAGSRRI